ncbi:uncharacterized protein N0V89_005642 [Didymosphaeria variabile]|uniref:Uncharacterized protein n=1 Tax=Didymosphaeria variabile TaxID=1932322 RepID=A0A9W8XLE6_9PLEO|nr:uncharacterized protein N0V89_005642 [Didymosphaeria variabile]KAJ4353911.1 hypothetical protein N0V89_005642 [Didymosphaeria variabile]
MSANLIALISKRNTEQSLFLRLPGELRNKIYAHVLAGMEYRVENYNGLCGKVSWKKANYYNENKDSYKVKKYRLAMVRTCRQIHEETKTIHAGLSTFHFTVAWMMVNWTIPQGTTSVVVHDTLPFDNALRPLGTSMSSIRDFAAAYVFWGDATTVTALRLQMVCRLPHHLRNVGRDDLRSIATPCVQQWVQGVREEVGAVKAGVIVTARLTYRSEELFTL